jgi:hypothetical protein
VCQRAVTDSNKVRESPCCLGETQLLAGNESGDCSVGVQEPEFAVAVLAKGLKKRFGDAQVGRLAVSQRPHGAGAEVGEHIRAYEIGKCRASVHEATDDGTPASPWSYE